MIPNKLPIFISSTSIDLENVRNAIFEAIRFTVYLDPVGMEYFGADPRPPQEICENKVRDCSLFIGVVGDRRGWEPETDKENRSITQIEYETAISLNIPTYMSVLPEGTIVQKGDEIENDDKVERQVQFRFLVSRQHGIIDKFDNPDKLASQLVASVTNNLMLQRYEQQVGMTYSPDKFVSDFVEKTSLKGIEVAVKQQFFDPEYVLGNDELIDTNKLIEQFWNKAIKNTENAIEYYEYVAALTNFSDPSLALKAYERIVEIDPKHRFAWNMIGVIQSEFKENANAKAAFDEALELAEKENDDNLKASISGNIAILLSEEGDFSTSLEIFDQLEIFYINQSLIGELGLVHLNVGSIRIKQEKFDLAKLKTLEACNLFEKLNDVHSLALAYLNLVEIECRNSVLSGEELHYQYASNLGKKAHDILLKCEDQNKLALAKIYLGNLESYKGNNDKALIFWQDALVLFKQLKSCTMINQIKKLINDVKA